MSRDLVPTVETDRLVLRAFCEEDLDAFSRINADPDVMRFIGNGAPLDREETWRSMGTFLGHWALRGYGIWAVEEKASGSFVGRIGLFNPEGWPGLEVGWLLARDVWGKGFATEGGRASLEFAWNSLGAERVISMIRPENAASIRVAERLGERYERSIEFKGSSASIYGIDRPGS